MGSLEKQLRNFRKRYNVDDKAFEFLQKSFDDVIAKVLSDFDPPDHIEDCSAVLTSFVRQVRKRIGNEGKSSQGRTDTAPERHGRTRRTLQDLVFDVGKRLKRSPQDCEPIIDKLTDNWYDNLESLNGATKDDLTSVGIPMRFANELLAELEDQASPAEGRTRSNGSGGAGHGKGKDIGYGDTKGKKGKGRGRDSKGRDDRDDQDGGHTQNRGKSGKGGKSKGNEKGSSGQVELLIPVDVADLPSEDVQEIVQKMIGTKGENMKYISAQTNAYIHVTDKGAGRGGSKKLQIQIKAPDSDSLDEATDLVNELVTSVFDEFESTGVVSSSEPASKRRRHAP